MLNHWHSRSLYHWVAAGILMLMRSALRLASIGIGTCVYVSLAILGWGGFGPFFSHSALIVLVVVVVFALSIVSFFAGGNLSPGVREACSNRWVLPVFGVIGLLNAYLPADTARRELWTIDGDTIRWLGIGLFAPVVLCGSGQSLYWANGSAAWPRFSRGILS
jgi:hypothetical protein